MSDKPKITKVENINCPHIELAEDIKGFETDEQSWAKVNINGGITLVLVEADKYRVDLQLCSACHDRVFAQLHHYHVDKVVDNTVMQALSKVLRNSING
jgi:hypothetical protein